MPAWGSSEKNQVKAHRSATDACPVTEAAGAVVSTVRVKSTRWNEAAASGIVNSVLPESGTCQQSSLVKRI
jgi:hypothetical protein